MSSLFEVVTKNRVVKGIRTKKKRRIMGTQGNWYPEKLYFLADSEAEARNFALEQLEKRRILGVSMRREKFFLQREIEIIKIRRIA